MKTFVFTIEKDSVTIDAIEIQASNYIEAWNKFEFPEGLNPKNNIGEIHVSITSYKSVEEVWKHEQELLNQSAL